MKVVICFLLFNLLVCLGYSQKYTLSARDGLHMSTVYLGLPHDIDITVDGYKWKDIFLVTNNGKIEKRDDPHSFSWVVDTAGRGIIKVNVRTPKGIRTLGKEVFKVVKIPDPIAEVAGKNGGEIRKDIFQAQLGITTHVEGLCARFTVQHYSIIVIRNDEIIFAKSCEGPMFKGKVKSFFQHKLETGDVVIFCKLDYVSMDKKLQAMLPVQFTII